eukprot:688332-Amphidinium_carterae.1
MWSEGNVLVSQGQCVPIMLGRSDTCWNICSVAEIHHQEAIACYVSLSQWPVRSRTCPPALQRGEHMVAD